MLKKRFKNTVQDRLTAQGVNPARAQELADDELARHSERLQELELARQAANAVLASIKEEIDDE